jgi:hypothetical protein
MTLRERDEEDSLSPSPIGRLTKGQPLQNRAARSTWWRRSRGDRNVWKIRVTAVLFITC